MGTTRAPRALSRTTTRLLLGGLVLLSALSLSTLGCTATGGALQPGPDAQQALLEALLLAEPGGVVELAAGRFELDSTLSLDVPGVTIRGAGADETILDFSQQAPGTGGEGLLVTADDFVVESLGVENTRADGIKVEGTRGVTFRAIRVEWTNGPATENGAYGIYPVQCSDVLVEDSTVRGASDAGIYVGQSRNIIVRRNVAYENVAGIEIENSFNADVYDNVAHDNTGGILVFSLPEMPTKSGRDARVWNNEIRDNNTPNFGKPGAIVSNIPAGSGLILMASDNTDIFENRFLNNKSAQISIYSYLTTQRHYDDPEYDPYTEGVHIRDNVFEGGGEEPQGRLAPYATDGRFPDIVWDGVENAEKIGDGATPAELGLHITGNGDADFLDLDLGAVAEGREPQPSSDLSNHAGALPNPPGEVSLTKASA